MQLDADLAEKEEDNDKKPKQRDGRREGLAKGIKADRPRSTQPLVHDPGGVPETQPPQIDDDNNDDGDALDQLPTSDDLAQSFLKAESPVEKVELQVGLEQSQYLKQPRAQSASSEDESALGIGNGLSLPGFLADFLKGVSNRLELKINDIQLDVRLNLDLPTGIAANSNSIDKLDAVRLRLSIENLILNGISTSVTGLNDVQPKGVTKTIQREEPLIGHEVRRISLHQVRGGLISEASLFSNMSRFAGPSSPVTTQNSPVRKTKDDTPREAPPSSSPSAGLAMTQSTIIRPPDEETKSQTHLEDSVLTRDSEKYVDAGSEDGNEERDIHLSLSDLGESQYADSFFEHSFYSDETNVNLKNENIEDSETLPERLRQDNGNPSVGRSRYNVSLPQVVDETDPLPDSSQVGVVKHSEGVNPYSQKNASYLHESTRRDQPQNAPAGVQVSQDLSSSSHAASFTPPLTEDLTQSKIFSHEEAESMYMSAISYASSHDNNGDNLVPGGWVASGSDDDERITLLGYDPKSQDQQQLAPSGLGFSTIDEFQDIQPCVTPTRQLSGQISASSTTPAPEIQPETALPHNSATHGDTSSPSSESSSTESGSPLIIMKEVMLIDSIYIELLHNTIRAHDASEPTPESPTKEPNRTRASGVSSHLSGLGSADFLENQIPRSEINPSTSTGGQILKNEEPQRVESVSVGVGQVEILGDMGLTRLAILIVQQALTLLSRTSNVENGKPSQKSPSYHTKIQIARLSWKLLDLLKGSSVTGARDSSSKTAKSSGSLDSDVLLAASLERIEVTTLGEMSSSKSKLTVGKFTFGYASDHILSFDSGLKMRDSTRDILAPVNDDVLLYITRRYQTTEISLYTLPLHIALDLRRLDETFSWFGGFSSILGLGSSIMSSATIVDTRLASSHTTKAIRGVRFEVPAQTDTARAGLTHTQSKTTVRIGGLLLDLQGVNCALRIRTTAMKLVHRAEGVGLVIDKLKLSGPYLRPENDDPSITARLANIRVEYTSTPKEVDLTRLLALLSPSRNKYERDDDILLDTLLHQRRQGGVVRITIEGFQGGLSRLHDLQYLPELLEELKKLSTVTKYLPEDDRPGILTLALIHDLRLDISIDNKFGTAICTSKNLEVAHVTLPVLMALGVSALHLHRNHIEELLGQVSSSNSGNEPPTPMLMARYIGDEMEPTVKIKLWNVRAEYHVSTIMAIMGLSDDTTGEAFVADMVNSVVNLTSGHKREPPLSKLSRHGSSSSEKSVHSLKILNFDIGIRESVIGLNPRNSSAKGIILVTDTHIVGALPQEDYASAVLDIKRASFMIIDDTRNIVPSDQLTRRGSLDNQFSQAQHFTDMGYVSVSYMSAAKATLQIIKPHRDAGKSMDIEIRDELFVLDLCADSTQTLLGILNGLKPPMPVSTELKYRTEVVPVDDMLASFTGNAYTSAGIDDEDDSDQPLGFDEGDMVDDDVPQNLEFVSSFYNPNPRPASEGIADSMLEDDLESLASPPMTREIGDKTFLGNFQEQYEIAPGGEPLDFQEDHFSTNSGVGGTAHRWDTKHNTYGLSNEVKVRECPLRLRVRDVHIIWNLFDGYDWQHTRDTISQAVADVESKAAERMSRKDRRKSFDADEDEESVIGDFLFNSIYIGVPANREPRDLARQVNRNLDDLASETESFAPTTASSSPSRQSHVPRAKRKKLRLNRSKQHKMSFELKGVSVDLLVFPPTSDEVQSSIDIRVQDLEIFDNVPTSTWKKFATYMHDAGERESGTSMIHLEILNVKPVPDLAASEIILKVSLPIPRTSKSNENLTRQLFFHFVFTSIKTLWIL